MRKSPIRHKVQQHNREGRAVRSFGRGKGVRPVSRFIIKKKLISPVLTGIAMVKEAKLTGLVTHETPFENISSILKEGKIYEPFVYQGWRKEPEFVDKNVAAMVHINIPQSHRGSIGIGMRKDELSLADDIPLNWIHKIVRAKTGKVIYP